MTTPVELVRKLLARHLQTAPLADVERLAAALLDEPKLIEPSRRLSVADGRYMRLDADRTPGVAAAIPDDRWVATWDRETDLVWSHVLGNDKRGQPWAESIKIAQSYDLFGVKWDASEIYEHLSIIDYARSDPAVDPDYFRGPYGYHWTKTVSASAPADGAWGVFLVDGDAGRDDQGVDNRVRARCAGQSLGLRS